MKNQIAVNLSRATSDVLSELASYMGLSRNVLIESICVTECLKNKGVKFSNEQLDELLDGYLTKGESKVTLEFKKLHKTLPKDVKEEVIKFFYEINKLVNIKFSTKKQANFYKANDDYLFYYGILNMKEMPIEDYLNRLDIITKTFGEENCSYSEYIYIAKMQQFKHASKKSKYFDSICLKLNVDSCDCIRIHYQSLMDFLEILRTI